MISGMGEDAVFGDEKQREKVMMMMNVHYDMHDLEKN